MTKLKGILLTEGMHGMISQVEGLAKALELEFIHEKIELNNFWKLIPPSLTPVKNFVFKNNIEKDFDIDEEKYDFAFLMNVLEHIYNYKILLININKSLKNGGHLEGFVPFLYQYHADSDDFFRYTHTGLARILEDSGFVNIKVTKIGVGMFVTIASMSSRILVFRLLIYIWWLVALLINMILSKIWKKNRFFYAGLAFSAVKKT